MASRLALSYDENDRTCRRGLTRSTIMWRSAGSIAAVMRVRPPSGRRRYLIIKTLEVPKAELAELEAGSLKDVGGAAS